MLRNRIAVIFATCVGLTLGYAAVTGSGAMAHTELPSGLDQSLIRVTQHGAFRVTIASAEEPVPLHKVHAWTVKLTDAAGRPVTGATFEIGGGMPQHGHGLPTAPVATPAGADGTYVINGVKFSMDGWWELTLQITAGGISDSVTFNIVL